MKCQHLIFEKGPSGEFESLVISFLNIKLLAFTCDTGRVDSPHIVLK